MTDKPYSEACEQNKDPILSVLREVFICAGTVLELGSGTGQHAVYFARHLAHLTWQPTDLAEGLSGIEAWRLDAGLPNVEPALELDVDVSPWPRVNADYVFSANTTHIMSWDSVQNFLKGIGEKLNPGGAFCLYGPFNYNGRYTSESNARFDQWLKARDPNSGIRDFGALDALARSAGLTFDQDIEMPVNNRILIWRRGEKKS